MKYSLFKNIDSILNKGEYLQYLSEFNDKLVEWSLFIYDYEFLVSPAPEMPWWGKLWMRFGDKNALYISGEFEFSQEEFTPQSFALAIIEIFNKNEFVIQDWINNLKTRQGESNET